MKDIYKKHFLMNTTTVVDFVRDCVDYFPPNAKLVANEIGDGNINYVFKVLDENTGKSLVVKQADKLLRSSGRPLDLHRNKIEVEILKYENELAPGYVPKIYDYNEEMCALVMEDISSYKNMRMELDKGKIFKKFSEDITDFLVNTLLQTTDLVLDRHEKKKRVQLFTNIDLCDISEDLVFTEPYYDYKKRNIITKGMHEFVENTLYKDEKLKSEVGYLRNNFMNNAQALIHGDLHSGSIFINEDGIKVIDPEFAFYGPMGYDIGNIIGNMFFSLTNKMCLTPENREFINWISQSIVEVFDLFKYKFTNKLDELVNLPLYNHYFKVKYLKEVLADSIGYAGTEIIRRTVGDSKVTEITSVLDYEKRIKLEKILITFGSLIIKNRYMYNDGKDIINEFLKVVAKYEFS